MDSSLDGEDNSEMKRSGFKESKIKEAIAQQVMEDFIKFIQK